MLSFICLYVESTNLLSFVSCQISSCCAMFCSGLIVVAALRVLIEVREFRIVIADVLWSVRYC